MNHRNQYVLMTAAYNEGANIGGVIESVLSQSVLPAKWIIVSDGSTDNTDEIVAGYEERYPWIRCVHVTRKPGRNFASKVIALQQADDQLRRERFDVIGNIDADVTLEPDYFAQLLDRMAADPQLGIASGFIYEKSSGQYVSRPLNSEDSVPHAAQLVRRACYEAIGGYAVLRYGGEDWHALISARMHGWRVKAFSDLKIFHRRPGNLARGAVRDSFRAGRMDYSLGSYPPFEVLKCLRRFPDAYFSAGVTRMCGFLWGYLRGEKRPVSKEFMNFLRAEQRERAIAFFKGSVRGSEKVPRHAAG
ncbi:MAG: glycosyltransferase family 2 protein [Acidobacteriales bacterium]|nr:glycosyltransferase family 2 protein [Terriglobales bacterium]